MRLPLHLLSTALRLLVVFACIAGAAHAETFTVETRIVFFKTENERLTDLSQYNPDSPREMSARASANLQELAKTDKPQFDIELVVQVAERAPQPFRIKSQGYTIGGNVILDRDRDDKLAATLDRIYFTHDDKSVSSSTVLTSVRLPCSEQLAAVQLGGMSTQTTSRWGKQSVTVEALFVTLRVSQDRMEPEGIANPRSKSTRFNPQASTRLPVQPNR